MVLCACYTNTQQNPWLFSFLSSILIGRHCSWNRIPWFVLLTVERQPGYFFLDKLSPIVKHNYWEKENTLCKSQTFRHATLAYITFFVNLSDTRGLQKVPDKIHVMKYSPWISKRLGTKTDLPFNSIFCSFCFGSTVVSSL